MMTTVSPDMFPGDPVRAAAAIYEVVASESPRHWVVLGSDAQRRIGAKLDMLRAEFEAGADTAPSTGYPWSAKADLLPAPTAGSKGNWRENFIDGDGSSNWERTRTGRRYR